MRILITGVNGLIGSKLAEKLLCDGHTVVGLGRRNQCGVASISQYFQGDVLDKKIVKEAMQNVDAVVHLAALTEHKDIVDNKFAALEINFLGTKNILEQFSISATAKKLIWSSSGKVYGKIKSLPITEEHPTQPINILGKSKLITEQLIDFYSTSQKSFVILRIFNVYGPQQKPNFLVPTILKKLQNETYLVLGDLEAQRDYTYVDDVVNAFVLSLKKELGLGLSTFNICSGKGNTAREIAGIIGELSYKDIKVNSDRKLVRRDEVSIEYGSYEKARRVLGWEPIHSLLEGLKKTITSGTETFKKEDIVTKRMKILVTGGAGFIGSNVAANLVSRGHEVIVIDNFSLGKEENLAPIMDRIKLVRGSITDESLVKEITQNVDVIVNLAAASASPMFAMENVREAVKTNIDGFLILLKVAKENRVKRVVYASTSSIYGDNSAKLAENSEILPSNMYAATKLGNEYFAKVFSLEHGLETVGFRFLSVYGPNEESKGRFSNLASQFTWAIMQNNPVVIYGDGSQKRDFTHVKDVAQAIALGVESNQTLMGEIFNVGSGESFSLNELATILSKIIGKEVKPQYIQNPVKNYIWSQDASINKITEVLGYKPQFSLEKGLRDLIIQVKLDQIRNN